MSISSDGQLCYGIEFDYGYEFPWDDENFEGDIEEWWRFVNGYEPPFQLYDGGDYVGGVRPPEEKIDEWYDHRKKFDDEHPLPIACVLHCSYDYGMYILAVKGTYYSASRGYPKTIDNFDVDEYNLKTLIDFCKKYIKDDKIELKPKWILSSLYG